MNTVSKRQNFRYEYGDRVMEDIYKIKMQNEIGNKIHKKRISRRFTQEQLAERADVHRNYISNIENGRINPSILMLYRIAEGLDMDIFQLLE